MEPRKLGRKRPEAVIQEALIEFLKIRDWYVKVTHGNAMQSGLPDLYCCHRKYGPRWIEVKNPLAYSFTEAQKSNFPVMAANGAGIWILTAATEEEYKKLFREANWYVYLLAKL